MSDFELAYLLNEILNSSADRLIEFMTGLFAMLFASFVVGRKLSRGIVWTMIVLFTMFSTATIPMAIGTGARLAGVFRQIAAARATPGSDLDWVTVPPFDLSFAPWFVAVLLIGAYIGAILFLLQMRKGLSISDATAASNRT